LNTQPDVHSNAQTAPLHNLLRGVFGILLLTLILLVTLNNGTSPVGAQPPGVTPDDPVTTQDPNQPPGGGDNPFAATPTPDPFQPPPTIAPEVTEAVATPTEVPSLDDQAIGITLRARTDLEALASAALGGQRPEGWNGQTDTADPQFALLARLDLELLAGTLLGADQRPAGWFGVVGSTPYALARDIRHDVELLADTVLDQRPAGWLADEPIMSCDRATQAAVQLLELNGVFTLQADRTAPDFCQQATNEVSVFMEVNFLSNPLPGGLVLAPGVDGVGGPGTATITESFAVAFLDRGAGVRVGVVPQGTTFTPIARSFAQFSAMMLIRGEGFELFVDYNTTSVTRDAFDDLPNVDEAGSVPFCDADWCEAAG